LEDYSKRTLGRTEPGRWQHQWLLVDNQNKTAITLYAKSLEAKNKWIRALSEAMYDLIDLNWDVSAET